MQIKGHTIFLIIFVATLILGAVLIDQLNIPQKLRASVKSKMTQDFGGQVRTSNLPDPQDTRTPVFTFTLISDPHNNLKSLGEAVMQINKSSSDFTIGLGDYTDVGTTQELQSIKRTLNLLRKPFYSLPGDHDLWNGRDKTKDPLIYYRQEFGDTPISFQHNNVTFIFLDNSDLYKGITAEAFQKFESELIASPTNTIIILSHKAIYHPLTIHRMGYIQDEKNAEVANQAEEIVRMITQQTNKNIYMIHGDLHSSSKFSGPTDNITNYTIGSLARDKNFQTPRYAYASVYDDGTIKIKDVEVE